MDFDKLKNKKSAKDIFQSVLDVLGHQSETAIHMKKYTKQKTKIREAMKDDNEWEVMGKCIDGKSTACGSIFCDKCLEKRKWNKLQTYRNYVEKTFDNDENWANKRLRWVTVLDSLVCASISRSVTEKEIIKECCAARDNIKLTLRNMSRNNKNIWLSGAIHAELVDYSLYRNYFLTGGATTKVKTLTEFLCAYKKMDKKYFTDIDYIDLNKAKRQGDYDYVSGSGGKELYILIHFHALVDIGDLSDYDFRKRLERKWNLTSRQVDISRLWEIIRKKNGDVKANLDDNLKGMARYCYTRSNKNLSFSKHWGDGEGIYATHTEIDLDKKEKVNKYDWQSGEYYKGTRLGLTTYAKEMLDRDLEKEERLSLAEIKLLVKVHNAISGGSNDGLNVSIYKRH